MSGDLVAHFLELLECLGAVRAKRMFGGHGIFKDDRMFALVADGELYLKADLRTIPEFEAAGCEPFRYTRGGKTFSMSYYRCPDAALQNTLQMKPWATGAWQAALGAAAVKKKRKTKRKPRP